MSKSRVWLAAFAVSWVMMLSSFTPVTADTMNEIVKSGKMTIAVQTQGPPVSFIDKDGERTGLAIEIVRMMAEDMEVELEIQDYDWKGLIPALLSGKADFIAADMTPTPKRHMQIVFTEPAFFTENVAFSLKDKPFAKWQDLDKADVTLGAVQATTYADVAKKFLPEAKLKEFAGGTAQTVQALVAGRIDAGISDRATMGMHLKANADIKLLEGAISKEPLGFAVRPDSVHLVFFLNNYLRLIKHDGRLDALLDYWWFSTDWEADHN